MGNGRNVCGLSLLSLVFFSCGIADAATLQNENLIAPLPAGFKTGFTTQNGAMDMNKSVPAAESVTNWSRMITIQIFHGSTHPSPDRFANGIAQKWKTACAGGDAGKFKAGTENGYRFSLWMFICPLNLQTNKPENMWLKVVSGNDSLYSVQYAYRKDMSKDLIGPAVGYLRQILVCDTRLPDRPCPKGM